jgi:hypothetical protein
MKCAHTQGCSRACVHVSMSACVCWRPARAHQRIAARRLGLTFSPRSHFEKSCTGRLSPTYLNALSFPVTTSASTAASTAAWTLLVHRDVVRANQWYSRVLLVSAEAESEARNGCSNVGKVHPGVGAVPAQGKARQVWKRDGCQRKLCRTYGNIVSPPTLTSERYENIVMNRLMPRWYLSPPNPQCANQTCTYATLST